MATTAESSTDVAAGTGATSTELSARVGATVRVSLADGTQRDAVIVDSAKRDVAKAISTLAAWSALLVGILYALGRLLAELFYRRFGLSTSAAGLSSSDMIAQAAGAAVWLVIMSTLLTGVLLLIFPAKLAGKSVTDAWSKQSVVGRVVDFLVSIVGTVLLVLGPTVASIAIYGGPNNGGIPLLASSLAVIARFTFWPTSKGSDRSVVRTMYIGYAIVGLSLAVAGILVQASDVRRGNVETVAPWSLAPSVQKIRVEPGDSAVNSGVPTDHCVIELGHNGGAWLIWDPKSKYLWQSTASLEVRSCQQS